jgi:uncharacterized membrane-anchored protein
MITTGGAVGEVSLPADADGRIAAHDELHARPVAPITVPAMVTQLTVLTQDLTADAETGYLRGLAVARGLDLNPTDTGVAVTLDDGATLTWERHAEYSVHTVRQPLTPEALGVVLSTVAPDLLPLVPLPPGWLAGVPGRTLAAVHVLMLPSDGESDDEAAARAERLLGPGRLLGSLVKDGTARLYTTYRLRPDGTSRFLVLCADVSEGRAGRISSSLLDAERYRMLALLGFPAARRLVPRLGTIEDRLAEFTHAIEDAGRDDHALLDELIGLAAQVEAEIAAHSSRFGASLAYFTIVSERIDDLRGTSQPGLMGVFTFLRRRLLPAMATVESAGRRMDELSERVARTSDLLRTRVEVTTEAQSQDLLREIRRGQAVQLRLQETVEGLSIAAIAYYVVGLVGYAVKGLKAAGVAVDVELATALSVPFVVAGVWFTLHRVKRHLGIGDHGQGEQADDRA